MRTQTLLFTLFFIISIKLFPQEKYTQTIRGTIVDMHSEISLAGATVVLLGTTPPVGTITNENGEFRLKNVPVGRQGIQVSYIGYNTVTLSSLILKSGKEMVLNIKMEEKVITTDEVVVKAYSRKDQPINEMAMLSARSFTVEETERYAGSWYDPSRMAANYAGVMAAGDQRNDIIIRGNSPIGLLWRLDGINIPNPNHFGALGTTGGPMSILDNTLLDNSDFFIGAFPAEYGNALSGAFDLRMRTGNNEKREYTAQIGFDGVEFGLEGPFSETSKASYLANYRYSTMAGFDALGINFGVVGTPEYQDLSFKINVPGTKLGRFSVFGVGGLSHFELLESKQKSESWTFGTSGADIVYGSDMGVVGLSHTCFLNPTKFGNTRIKTNIAVSGTRTIVQADSINNVDNSPTLFYGDKFTEVKYSVSSQIKKKFNAKNNFSIGGTIDWFNVNYSDSTSIYGNGFTKLTDTKGELGLIQAFTQWQHKFSDVLILYSGIHFQKFTLNNSSTLEPRLSLKWNFLANQSLCLGFGMHSQLQPRLFYFTQTHLNDGTIIKTNKNLDFSKSNQLVLGYDYLLNPNLRIKIETYYQYLYDIPVEQKESTFSLMNYGADFYLNRVDSLVNEGTGKNYGIELTFEKFFFKNYYFLITASLFDSKYKASDGIERNSAFASNYVFNILGGYEFKIGKHHLISVNLKAVRAGGKRYIPIDLEKSINNTYIEYVYTGKTIYDYNRAYEQRYDDYYRIDARFTFKINRPKFNTELAIDIQNITNHKNIFMETFNSNLNEIKTDYQLGVFPLVLLRVQF